MGNRSRCHRYALARIDRRIVDGDVIGASGTDNQAADVCGAVRTLDDGGSRSPGIASGDVGGVEGCRPNIRANRTRSAVDVPSDERAGTGRQNNQAAIREEALCRHHAGILDCASRKGLESKARRPSSSEWRR
jgi:hypothetical protein